MKKTYLLLLISLLALPGLMCTKSEDAVITETPEDPLKFTEAEKSLIFSGARDEKMSLLSYFIYEDSLILRKKCMDVNPADTAEINHLTARMLKTVRDPSNPGVGLAAPQVGISRNIIWVQRMDKGTWNNRPFEVYLNPRITAYADSLVSRADGCLSMPGIQQNSMRAIWIDVEYMLPGGQIIQEHISHQYTAHIFQHEIDHLNGILFIDRFY